MNMVKNAAIVISNEATQLCTRCIFPGEPFTFSLRLNAKPQFHIFPCGDEHRGQMVEFLQVILREPFLAARWTSSQ